MKTGKEIIKDTVRTIPNKPGVYRMLDKNKNIIYVGNAKNLSKRTTNFQNWLKWMDGIENRSFGFICIQSGSSVASENLSFIS